MTRIPLLCALLLVGGCERGGEDATSLECLEGFDGIRVCGYRCAQGADGTAACADTPNGTCVLDPEGVAVCSQVMPRAVLLAAATPTECLLGADGRAACGWACAFDVQGIAACANTPDGICEPAGDGSLACSDLTPIGFAAPDGQVPAPECVVGALGAACGYNCGLGAQGEPACSSVPTGTCTLNVDGTLACP